jgi:hypothetical protein
MRKKVLGGDRNRRKRVLFEVPLSERIAASAQLTRMIE